MPAVTMDRYGYEISTASPEAAARYVEAVDLTLAADVGAPEAFEAAVEADEGFALGYAGMARMRQLRGEPAQAKKTIARATALAAGLGRRERGHVAAMNSVINDDMPTALASVREHLSEFPRDAFILSPASSVLGLIGFSGRQERNTEQLAFLDNYAEAYGDDWWFLSSYAFAHNEAGRPEEARPLIERSLELQPRSGNGAHTMAHVQFETGQAAEGATYLAQWLPGFASKAQLHRHIQWHYALFRLQNGDLSGALETYEQHIRPGVDDLAPLGTLMDSASFLWRVQLSDPDRELPWEPVAELASSAFPKPGNQFADAHNALAYAGCGDAAALERLSEALWQHERSGKARAGEMVPSIAESLEAFAREDYQRAAEILEPVADQVVRLGGSHAQREVFEDTLIEAWLRAGEGERAVAILEERLSRRPSARDDAWLERAGALAGATAGD
ncbi:MAG: tetratricopeptide repeat protein [Chloroflexi bacterium]|nr:tetratricopeptide repeat protein [Chloroflexota bacterium]MDA1147366.1 tetratricopeptide repeat protein [Chloroflexota bacterium]